LQIYLIYEYKDIDIEIKNKYILMIIKRNSLNNNIKIKVFKANVNNKNNKNNKLPID